MLYLLGGYGIVVEEEKESEVDEMSIIVQKFGGTSVATEESRKRVLNIVKKASEEYDGVIVVVSAMGRYGAPYATDTLLGLVDHNTEALKPMETDLLLSTGEIISSVVLSYGLKNLGVNSMAISGSRAGIVTDDAFTKADVLHIEKSYISSLLDNGIVPVIAGFQGRTNDFNVTTLGRGGSDTSAALLGEAFDADLVEIYTDVDGIMTADPKLCGEAKTLDALSYQEVFQMADSGAKVIHKGAVEVARRASIPLIIKNTFSDHAGTAITEYYKLEKKTTIDDKIITSIAHRLNRIQFSVSGSIDDDAFFKELAARDVSIDIINIFPNYRVFTTDSNREDVAIDVMEQFNATFSLIKDCAKVTIVGEKMTGVPGVMAKIIHGLKSEDVEILQTADSLATIACLIHAKDLEKAINALHKTFEMV